jgi:DNA-binding XRE family transcriptional regulator
VQNTEILRIIGRNIAAARLRAGMTQECLAELVDVHWKTISSIERGRYPFAVTTLARISSHLNVSIEEVFVGVVIKMSRAAARTAKALQRKRRPSA